MIRNDYRNKINLWKNKNISCQPFDSRVEPEITKLKSSKSHG